MLKIINDDDFRKSWHDIPTRKEKYRQHTIDRLIARYGSKRPSADYKNLHEKVKKQKGACLWAISGKKKLWMVPFKRKFVTVVYNNELCAIETILPQSFSLRNWLIDKNLIYPY